MKLFLAWFMTLSCTTMLIGADIDELSVDKNTKNPYVIMVSNTDVEDLLNTYKKIFSDTFISNEPAAHPQAKPDLKQPQSNVQEVQSSPKSEPAVPEEPKVIPPVQKVKKLPTLPLLDAKALMANKTMYLCYEVGPEHLKGRVAKMVFKKQDVTYDPMQETATPIEIPYAFDKNALILHFSGVKITHYVTEQTPAYLLAESMNDGVVVNKVRYYFDKEHAQAFVAGQ